MGTAVCAHTCVHAQWEKERTRDESRKKTRVTYNKETCFLFKALIGSELDKGRRNTGDF